MTTTDMCKYMATKGTAECLVERSRSVFSLHGRAYRSNVCEQIKYVIEEELKQPFGDISSVVLGIAIFNDKKNVPLQLLADVWNRAMFLLGYTQGNPCKKPLSKAKRNAKRS